MRQYSPDQWERFRKLFVEDANTECWLWTGSTHKLGYGRFTPSHKKLITAHRFAYEYFNGEIPAGLCVCHKCDIRGCVNPEHLFLGTQADNLRDASNKGRLKGRPKITRDDAILIRKWHSAGGWTQRDLGAAFGLHQVTIGAIVRGVTWR